ncbi:TetR/AcrR family transcriptional regulator [Kitasatospora sp. NBC_00240]|uniref:TetR/AcrR family transcriptional regulator n=1 Tax=Kitasatospora sp. NBC_00240 TaxID=2903567 RepID=UPI00225996D5|nr:TetR/AcrR family transcriptional regulator [Kitasatospora sp. NBC_00240]MCX5214561.1 TetR/AcrR family transcriptional regulator [Kitasatospora sp. NBC_00240]
MPEPQNPPALRERLIDAGVELVLTGGAAAVGLRETARRAGVSHGAPRRYFPTHEDLLAAIARRGFAELATRFAVATEGVDTPHGRLRALGRTYVGYALTHRGMFELMFRHELLDSERHPSDRTPLRESTLPLFGAIVALLADAGHQEPEVTAAALWANLHGLAQLTAWGSLQLVLGSAGGATEAAGEERDETRHDAGGTGTGAGTGDGIDGRTDRLITAVLDAHLGATP